MANIIPKISLTVWAGLVTTSLGCSPKGSEADGSGEVQGDPTTDSASTSTSGGATDSASSIGTSDTSGSTGGAEGSTGNVFLIEPDGGGIFECNPWTQDCPEGQKCMPWDNSGGSSWNATKCSPLDPSPGQPGDACTVEGSGVSGVDDCDVGAMCWDVDPETNTGTCVGFCQGTEENPSCDDPTTTCSITNGGVLILCLPTCDPLLQDCAEGNACYPLADTFVCAPDAGGETGAYGEGCEYLNVCDPGLFCANADVVPDCVGSQGCCSEFCDFDDPNATMSCSGAGGGQECIAYFQEGMAPPGFESVGVCAIP